MKKILSTALAIVLFVGASQAQKIDSKGHQRGDKKEAFQNLNLSAEQRAQFNNLQEAQRKEIQTLKDGGSLTPAQRKVIHDKYKTQYDALLTPAQKEGVKQKKEEWKDKADKGQRGQAYDKIGNRGNQAAFFKKELNLSTDQEAKLKSIFQDFRTKSQSLRSENNLTKEQKKTQLKTLAEQYMAQGKAVLTAEQLQKFDDLKGKRKGRRAMNV